MKTAIYLFVFIFFIFSNASSQTHQRTPFSKLIDSQIRKMSTEEIKAIADGGDAAAQMRMALISLSQRNVPEAIKWYQKAFESGDVEGAGYIAQLYLNTAVDGTHNIPEAMKWFQKEMDKGADLNLMFGRMYRNGDRGLPKDLVKAAYYLNLAAQNNDKTAIVWLAEMYLKGEGVKKDPVKAKELMSRLSETEINELGNGREILCELEGYEVKNPLDGDIYLNAGRFPPFFISRRVYRKVGESSYQTYFINSDGDLIKAPESEVDSDDSENSNTYSDPASSEASIENSTETPDSEQKSNEIISPSGKWSVTKPDPEKWGDLTMQLRDLANGVEQKIDIPGGGWGWNAISWNPIRDLFYFSILVGDSTGRASVYWQFDPASKTFIQIGVGQSLILKPDGKWLVWMDGEGGGDWRTRQIWVYDIENNINYTLTGGHADNSFDQWGELKSDEKVTDTTTPSNAVVCVENAKKFYKKDRFEEAIKEYKKAIRLDPNNAQTYGLLGYSYYRDQQLPQAIRAFQSSLKINPKELMSYYNLSLAYWANYQRGESIDQLKTLFSMDPKYKKLIKQDSQFNEILKSPYFKMAFEDSKK